MLNVKYAIDFNHGFVTHAFSKLAAGLRIYDLKSDKQEDLDSCVKSGDYFSTLVAILRLLNEKPEGVLRRQTKHLSDLIDDLVYLQKHYKIVRKDD